MWTPTIRRQHSWAGWRYEADLTDSEWQVIEPHLPPPCDSGRRLCLSNPITCAAYVCMTLGAF